MSYQVHISKKVLKMVEALPESIQKKFDLLLVDLRDKGPVINWPNFSKLGRDRYHCHLSYSWVACWKKGNGFLLIEVYYVGDRKDAPY
jgi:hypothetical protein